MDRETECPACSPDEPVWHEIVKEGQNPLGRCGNCGDIHPIGEKKQKKKQVRFVVSRADESFSMQPLFDQDDYLRVDQEIMLDDEQTGEVCPAIITSIESGDRRVDRAKISAIDAVWARATDQVITKVSVQHGGRTVSRTLIVPGERAFEVGMDISVGGEDYRITHIKIRNGKFLYRRGTQAEAKYVKRIFAKPADPKQGKGRTAWSMRRSTGN
jgi:uncharacterized Zn finger protein